MLARLLPLLLTLPLAGLAQSAPLAGRLEAGDYVSATGVFRVRPPVHLELGGRILDTPNVVTFEDDFSQHVSIACFPLDLTQKWELETRGQRDYLAYFFANFVMPDFERRYPGSTVEAERYLTGPREGALAVFCLLPGGSYFDGLNELAPGLSSRPRSTAKRGNLLFVRRGHVLVISTELAERVTQPSTFRKSPSEENDLLVSRLLGLVDRMSFPATAASPRR